MYLQYIAALKWTITPVELLYIFVTEISSSLKNVEPLWTYIQTLTAAYQTH